MNKRTLALLALLFMCMTFISHIHALNIGIDLGFGDDDDDDGGEGDNDDGDGMGSNKCNHDVDCENDMHLCDTAQCVHKKCVYTPIVCSDEDPCTINEQCNVMTGMCISDMAPECTQCTDCCEQNPVFREQILFTNRGDRTTSVLDAGNEVIRKTVFHNPNAEPMYLSAPGCCDGSNGNDESEYVIVGDRLNSVVRFLDARTLEEYLSLTTDQGVGHMDQNLDSEQLWVVCDISRTLSVISLSSFSVLEQSVAAPNDLSTAFVPLDVVVGNDFAIVSFTNNDGTSLLVKYSTTTFLETDRLTVPANPYLFYTGSGPLFVASQEGNQVLSVNVATMTIVQTAVVPGARGLWAQDGVLFVTSIIDNDGDNSLFVFDVSLDLLLPVIGSPFDLPTRNPHNIVPTNSRDKLFVTHTRDSRISVCDLAFNGAVLGNCRDVQMEGGFYNTQASFSAVSDIDGSTIEPGFSGSLGVVRIKPLCECSHSCFDGDACTEDVCHDNGYTYECLHNVIPECGMDPHCPHDVNVTVLDYSILTVEEEDGHYEICHTSTYLGNDSAVVIGFDPYNPCSLNQRGTCDNREAIHDVIPAFCVSEALGDGNGCTLSSGDHAISMPGLAIDLVWDYNTTQPTFVLDTDQGTGILQGVLHDPLNPDLVLRVEINLGGLVPVGVVPTGAPNTPFAHDCYAVGGGYLDPLTWRYFTSISGSIYAMPGTTFEGLLLTIDGLSDPFQIGEGANAKNSNYGMEGRFSWSVAHQPLDPLISVNAPVMYSTINVDLDQDCTANIDYCALFGEPQENPANGWDVTLDGTNITYCRSFTLSDIISCRAYGLPHDQLFNYTVDHNTYGVEYEGTLYATSILPLDCDQHGETCGDDVIYSTNYDIQIILDADGTISVNFERASLEFDARWIRNLWLEDGDIKVVFETRVFHIESDVQNPHTTYLEFHHMESETGYPLTIAENPVPCDNQNGYCYQQWCLISEDAYEEGITDFSGIKRLVFAVKVNDETKIYVTLNLHIEAHHLGGNTIVHDTVEAELQLYSDQYLQDPYEWSDGTYFIDCSKIYGALSFGHYYHNLEAVIKRAYICYSLDFDMIPYDANHPYTTGCNTPGLVHKDLVYSNDPQDDVVEYHQFELTDHLPEIYNQDFCYVAHAVTPRGQLLQIEWHAVDPQLQYKTNEGLIEGALSVDIANSKKTVRSEPYHYTPADDCDYDHSIYAVHCEYGQHYDHTLHRCISEGSGHGDDNDYRPHYGRPYYGDNDDDDSHSSNSLAYGLIVFLLLAAIVIVLYMFGCCGGVIAIQHRSDPQVVHQHFVSDNDVIVNGNNNHVAQMPQQSAWAATGHSNQQYQKVQHRRTTNNTYNNTEEKENPTFIIFE